MLLSFGSTGFNGLDNVLNNLRKGDNVVWQVNDVSEYKHFVTPFVQTALASSRKVVYMRFARHDEVVEENPRIIRYQLDASSGFESFSTQIHSIITKEGRDTYYVFDCLSDLLSAWATDLMVGNFFVVTCPYLFELDTLAYFAIIRNNHSFKTVARIRETTQLLLDIYKFENSFYVHPLKVWKRYSSTMFLPHIQVGELFKPITNSTDASKLLSYMSLEGLENAKRNLDYWDRLFLEAEQMCRNQSCDEEKHEMVDKLCRIMIGGEKRILSLVKENITLEDLLDIRKRLIGTGFIGGKSVGMLVARKILLKDNSADWQNIFEPHDSFYIGSDVFYTYIVQNGWWKLRMKQKTKEGYFEVASELKNKFLTGIFPDEIKEQFLEMMEYFGQSPIIIRSSSLLEDGFGNAFAGKYESIFSVNQGSPEERFNRFENYVREIFASTMDEDALTYRLQRGLDQQDEQMALLVQRVSGSYHKNYFFPDLAGVGVSYNTFVWNHEMDPKAGMLRLVFGLGTRAVNRVEDDYPRIIALDNPNLRPYANIDDIKRFSQHKVDVLNVSENALREISLSKIMGEGIDISMDLFGTKDYEATRKLQEFGKNDEEIWTLTFDKLLSETAFIETMSKMLKILEKNYQYPVDVEFTVNFKPPINRQLQINLLQCRPLQTKGVGSKIEVPVDIEDKNLLFRSEGNFMGGSISEEIKRVIYVDPKGYSELSQSEKYSIARIIGRLNRQINKEKLPTMLIGPGRWGTTTPSLGIPVRFSEINNMAVLVEISYIDSNLMPELSFGTHFFQDLVETDIFYIALFPERSNCYFNTEMMNKFDNQLKNQLPDLIDNKSIIKVCDVKNLHIFADVISQKVFFGPKFDINS